ncbi:hypothetical protein BSKO_10226 [Bryopsis sp. KO-2023]|nr:hypothetical protein BSKO_10226 [Bryopsis sp. KO-2023]
MIGTRVGKSLKSDFQVARCSRSTSTRRVFPQPIDLRRRFVDDRARREGELGSFLDGGRQLREGEPRHVTKASNACFAANDWSLWTALLGCAFASQVIEETAVGRLVSSPLLAIGFGWGLAACGVIPTWCPTYDIVWSWCIPLAAVLYILEADLSKLLSAGGATLVAFLLGSIGTILGTLAAWALVGTNLGNEGWKLASALCATYIGGSVNLAATAKMVGLANGSLMAATVAVDNVVMAIYLALISLIPAKKGSRIEPKTNSTQSDMVEAGANKSLILWLLVASLCCALGDAMATALRFPAVSLAFTALFASLIGPLFNGAGAVLGMLSSIKSRNVFEGCQSMGGALTLLFFVTIGAACGSIGEAISTAPWLFVFIGIQLLVHFIFTFSVSKKLRLPMRAILTASNANVGGPFTAAGMAGARGWQDMVQPAILTGSLGYTIATIVSFALSTILQ